MRSGALVVVDAAERMGNGNGGGEHGLVRALEAAAGGTLLIEHVDRLPEEAQVILIRALDRGGDVRFIATSTSTREDLGIRRELLARLSGYCAMLPPLRERIGDFGLLIAELAAARNSPPFEIEVSAMRAMLAYSWPGNIRELDRCLQVATTLARGKLVRLEHLPPELRSTASSEAQA
jgi:transcriptional regulator of acetoin/glycerol metabolism